MPRTLHLLPLALAAGIAFAAPAHADPEYDACVDKAGTNRDFSACGSAMLARREAVLNRVWKKAYADLDPVVKKVLLAEQRAWIAYKDKSCLAWTTGYFGREGQVIHFYACRGDVIDARIAYLEHLGGPGEPGADG
jgi:uncharacterized protein YecT (DUF1311 family)